MNSLKLFHICSMQHQPPLILKSSMLTLLLTCLELTKIVASVADGPSRLEGLGRELFSRLWCDCITFLICTSFKIDNLTSWKHYSRQIWTVLINLFYTSPLTQSPLLLLKSSLHILLPTCLICALSSPFTKELHGWVSTINPSKIKDLLTQLK